MKEEISTTVTRQALQQRRLKAKGLCVRCGQKSRPNRVLCLVCAVADKARGQKYYRTHTAERKRWQKAWRKRNPGYSKAWRKRHPNYCKAH